MRSVRRYASVVAALATLGVGALTGTASAQAASHELKPVASLDVARYLGEWNQVAAIPQPFNIDCLRNTKANYSRVNATNIAVRNTCTKFTGQRSGITGNARVNDRKTNAQLHVSFPGVPFQSSASGPTNYVVTYIAPDYSWALVGSPERLSGFVLKRDKHVSPAQWRAIKSVVSARSYNSCLFVTTPIDGAFPRVQPLCTVR